MYTKNLFKWAWLFCLILFAACAAQIEEGGLDGLAFEVTSQVGEDTVRDVAYLELTAFITNESGTPKELEYGSCALSVNAYPTAGRTGEPVWDGERLSEIPYECTLELFTKTLEPGERWTPPEFTERYDLDEIPLADGRYYLTASVSLNWTETEPLSAGDVYLDTTFTR